MATVVAAKNVQAETMHIRLVQSLRSPSQWVKSGTENDPRPIRLETSETRQIKDTSSMLVWDDNLKMNVLKSIRYIPGCTTIFVDEQKLLNIQPRPIDAKKDLVIEGDSKFLYKEGNPALWDYFLNYEGNVDAPHRPKTARDIYEIVKEVEIAEDSIDTYFDSVAASDYLKTLVVRENGKATIYKEREINMLVELFKLGHIESTAEKMKALIDRSRINPTTFIQEVEAAKGLIFDDIAAALQLKVLKFNTTQALLIPTNEIIVTLKSAKEEQQNELAAWFLTKEGSTMYDKFATQLQIAKEKSVGVN